MLARRLGLPDDEVELIQIAAPLHDVGIIGVPSKIILKPGPLSTEEHQRVKKHVEIGAKMLSYGDTDILKLARLIALTHHERFDGTGYPRKLKGDNIPLVGQIVALADFFDTLTHHRPYRRAWSVEEAISKVKRRSGSEFNPRLVTAFMRVLTEKEERFLVKPKQTQGLQLRGTVDIDTLYDLIISLTHNNKSSKVLVYVGFSEATLLIFKGRLVHAEFNRFAGEEGLMQMLAKAESYPSMDFMLEPFERESVPEELVTIRTPTQRLLLETAAELDHRREARNTVV
jgi:hypothetical protein